MKVCIFGIGDLSAMGGVQLSYAHLCRYLVDRDWQVEFFSHATPKGHRDLYYDFPQTVRFHYYKLQDNQKGRSFIQDAVNDCSPDVVLIVNGNQDALIIASALFDLPYPVILSIRAGPDYNLRYACINQNQRVLNHYSVDFSHMLMNSYRYVLPKYMRSQLNIIASLIQPAEKYAQPDQVGLHGRYTILYTGRFTFEKDLDILVKAFATVAKEYSDWDLRLVGNVPEDETLTALSKSLGVSDRVFLVPYKKSSCDVYQEYLSAHLFVLPSRAEGCPLALREAMAHGLPVVGFDNCSGTNEIIVSGRNGLLARSDDKVVGLSEALSYLMADGNKRVRLGQQAIADVSQYDPVMINHKWHKMLQQASRYKGRRWILRLRRFLRYPFHFMLFRCRLSRLISAGSSRNCYFYRLSLKDIWNRLRHRQDYSLLFGSVLFDPKYYLRENFVLKTTNQDPLLHYVTKGWKLGLSPSMHFDVNYYVDQYMDGDLTKNPLVHCYSDGRFRGNCCTKVITEQLATQLLAEKKYDQTKRHAGWCLPLVKLIVPPWQWHRN